MLTDEEFASLLLIGAPSTYGSPAKMIPAEHSVLLIALGYLADNQGRFRMTTPGRIRLAAGMCTTQAHATL